MWAIIYTVVNDRNDFYVMLSAICQRQLNFLSVFELTDWHRTDGRTDGCVTRKAASLGRSHNKRCDWCTVFVDMRAR